jgi:hypothetical protein
MRITTIITMTALMGLGAQAAEPAGDRPVTVCMGVGTTTAETIARKLATRMFADIGVTLDWRNPRACPADAIRIGLTDGHPDEHRGPLAYALPYEGVHIRVFYDRILRYQRYDPNLVPNLLAHVLVHEITHILQGTERHSGSGVMKANWEVKDFSAMVTKPLRFEDEDIGLIRKGLAVRCRLRRN